MKNKMAVTKLTTADDGLRRRHLWLAQRGDRKRVRFLVCVSEDDGAEEVVHRMRKRNKEGKKGKEYVL